MPRIQLVLVYFMCEGVGVVKQLKVYSTLNVASMQCESQWFTDTAQMAK